MCQCKPATNESVETVETKNRGGVVRFLLDLALVYVLLVFGGGTLIQTGHPVAVEAGRLMHTVALVEPAIGWAEDAGQDVVANGLGVLARGIG